MLSRRQVEVELAEAEEDGHIPNDKVVYVRDQIAAILDAGGEWGPQMARLYLRRCLSAPHRIGVEPAGEVGPRPGQQQLSGVEEFLPSVGHPAQPKGDA